MENLQQSLLSKSIELLKYENPTNKQPFDLSTIHCELINRNPRFTSLKLKIEEYNNSVKRMELKRPNIESSYFKKVYVLLSELTRIPNPDNQIKFLNQIYEWVFPLSAEDHIPLNESKLRPLTSYSSKKLSLSSNKIRPSTTKVFPKTPRVLRLQPEFIDGKIIEKYPHVNFDSLSEEERDFYLGHRTIHPEEEIPQLKLKEQNLKMLIKPKKMIEAREPKSEKSIEEKKSKLVRIPLRKEMITVEKTKQCLRKENKEEVKETVKQNEIGCCQDSEQEEMDAEEHEESYSENRPIRSKERLKSYVRSSSTKRDTYKLQLAKGLKKEEQERIKSNQKELEDKGMVNLVDLWTNTKNKAKKEQKRKAESARLIINNIGYKCNPKKFNTSNKTIITTENTIDFSNIPIINIKENREKISFKAHSDRFYNETMRNALKSGNLENHIKLEQQSQEKKCSNCFITERTTRCANRSYQKDFEEILKNAKERSKMDTEREIENAKDILVKHEISVEMTRLHKSLSHEPITFREEPVVGIMGLGMMKNSSERTLKRRKSKKLKRGNY